MIFVEIKLNKTENHYEKRKEWRKRMFDVSNRLFDKKNVNHSVENNKKVVKVICFFSAKLAPL